MGGQYWVHIHAVKNWNLRSTSVNPCWYTVTQWNDSFGDETFLQCETQPLSFQCLGSKLVSMFKNGWRDAAVWQKQRRGWMFSYASPLIDRLGASPGFLLMQQRPGAVPDIDICVVCGTTQNAHPPVHPRTRRRHGGRRSWQLLICVQVFTSGYKSQARLRRVGLKLFHSRDWEKSQEKFSRLLLSRIKWGEIRAAFKWPHDAVYPPETEPPPSALLNPADCHRNRAVVKIAGYPASEYLSLEAACKNCLRIRSSI